MKFVHIVPVGGVASSYAVVYLFGCTPSPSQFKVYDSFVILFVSIPVTMAVYRRTTTVDTRASLRWKGDR